MFYLVLALNILFALNSEVMAQDAESQIAMPSDSSEHHLFTDNPAFADPNKFGFGYAEVIRSRKAKAKLDWDTSHPKVSTKVRENDHALALLFPLGAGAAIGVTGQLSNQKHESNIDTSDRSMEESFSKRTIGIRAIINIVDKVRAGFGIRYALIDDSVFGAFFIPDDEKMKIKGSMTGFTTGLHYGDGPLHFGAAYTAPMRGKIKVHGEQLIATEAGFINLDLGYGKEKDWRWGLAAKRWLHKADDRSEPYTIPNTERRVSLRGIDLEQYLYPVIRYGIGMDTPMVFNDFYLRFGIQQTEYVFLFEEDAVPGDEPDAETKLKALGAKTAIAFSAGNFMAQAGYSWEQRKKSSVDDTEGRIGNYIDYKSEDKTIFASFNYKH